MRLREVREGDASELLGLMTRIDSETEFMLLEAGERQTTVEEHRERIKGVVARDNQTILVAESEGRLVGYLAAIGAPSRRVRHRAYVAVGVLQAFTGRGVGTRLFEELEAWARRHGVSRLELTVRTDNKRGTRLYEKMGFAVEGVKKRSLRVSHGYVDEYYMARLLPPDEPG